MENAGQESNKQDPQVTVFKLHKWYYDLLVPGDFFLFVYFGRIKLFGFSEHVLHVFKISYKNNKVLSKTYKFNPNGDDLIFNEHNIQLKGLEMGISRQDNVLKIKADNVDIDLRYIPIKNPGEEECQLVIPANKGHQITWYPLHLKGSVSGYIKIGADNIRIEKGNGYIDHLSSNVFPLKAPVSRLYWGRIHNENLDLAYTITTGKKENQQWNNLIVSFSGHTFQFNQLQFSMTGLTYSENLSLNYPQTIEIKGQNRCMTIKISIDTGEAITESGFVNNHNGESMLKTRFLRYIAKDPRGIKFLSTADIEVDFNNQIIQLTQIPGISEVVVFN